MVHPLDPRRNPGTPGNQRQIRLSRCAASWRRCAASSQAAASARMAASASDPARRPPPPHGTRGRARPRSLQVVPPLSSAPVVPRETARRSRRAGRRSGSRHQYRVPRCQLPDHERQHVGGRPAAAAAPGGTEPCLPSRAEIGSTVMRGVKIGGSGSYSRPPIASAGSRTLADDRTRRRPAPVAEDQPAAPLTGRGIVPERDRARARLPGRRSAGRRPGGVRATWMRGCARSGSTRRKSRR